MVGNPCDKLWQDVVWVQVTTTSYEGAVPELMNGTPELLGWPETSQLGPTCDLPAKELGLSKKVTIDRHSCCYYITEYGQPNQSH